MLDYYVHTDSDHSLDPKRNWLPKQTMWPCTFDRSLKRMTFEAAFFGLHADKKYGMNQKIKDWYNWDAYFSWRDLPRDCSQLMSLYVGEIHRLAAILRPNPARCVGILLRADQEAIVPIRVEQAAAIFAILQNVDPADRDDWLETLDNYRHTRPDFTHLGAAFQLTEVGASNFTVKIISSGQLPGFDGFYNIMQARIQKEEAKTRPSRPEGQRNLLESLVFNDGDDGN